MSLNREETLVLVIAAFSATLLVSQFGLGQKYLNLFEHFISSSARDVKSQPYSFQTNYTYMRDCDKDDYNPDISQYIRWLMASSYLIHKLPERHIRNFYKYQNNEKITMEDITGGSNSTDIKNGTVNTSDFDYIGVMTSLGVVTGSNFEGNSREKELGSSNEINYLPNENVLMQNKIIPDELLEPTLIFSTDTVEHNSEKKRTFPISLDNISDYYIRTHAEFADLPTKLVEVPVPEVIVPDPTPIPDPAPVPEPNPKPNPNPILEEQRKGRFNIWIIVSILGILTTILGLFQSAGITLFGLVLLLASLFVGVLGPFMDIPLWMIYI